METRRLSPAGMELSDLRAFMQAAWEHLMPGINAALFTTERTGDAPNYISTDFHGTKSVGYTVREESSELDRGHYTETEIFLRGDSYGLPDGGSLSVSHGGDTISFSVNTGDHRERDIAHEFDRRFDLPPGRAQLDNLSIRASMALRRQEWSGALEFGNAVLKYRPRDEDALLAVGVASGALGDEITCEIALTDLSGVRPLHVDALYNLARLRRTQGNPTEALSLYERALAAAPKNQAVLYQMATVLEEAGRIDEAKAAYEKAVSASPNPRGTWGYSGMDFTEAAADSLARLKA